MEKGHEIWHFWAILQFGTGAETGVVPIPTHRIGLVPVPMLPVALIFVLLIC